MDVSEDELFRPKPKLEKVKVRCKCCGELRPISEFSSSRAKTCRRCMYEKKMKKNNLKEYWRNVFKQSNKEL
jgi:CTP:phosphocholine cytidylyltransferase-like protein